MALQIIWVFLFIIGVILSLRSLKWGLLFYLVGALIFPVLWVGEIALRFELVYCLWLFLLLLAKRLLENKHIYWHFILSRYGLYLITVVVATIITIPMVGEVNLLSHLISFYGILRPLLVMLLFLNISLDKEFLKSVLWVFVSLSIPLALLTIGQSLGIGIFERITLQGYTSPWRTPILGMLREVGIIARGTGVFESPVYNAAYFLIVLIISGLLLVRGGLKRFHCLILYLSLGFAFVGGIMTYSSTFLLGLLICAVLFVLFVWPKYKHGFLRNAVGIACIVILIGFLLVPKSAENFMFASNLSYQAERIRSGSVLDSRYDPTTGILKESYQAIMERPVLGWGLTQKEGVFIGDSIYISVLYRSGIIGFGFFFWTFWNILKHTWRYRDKQGMYGTINKILFLFTLLLLAVGVGQPSFFVLRIQECYWALVGMSLNRTLRISLESRG